MGRGLIDEKLGEPLDSPAFEELLLDALVGPDALPASVSVLPPTTTKVVTPAPNAAGWHNTVVKLDFTATDDPIASSGIDVISVDEGHRLK